MYHFINDNFHTDIATVPPSYKMKHFHEHNRWELMFIYSGSCTLYVGDEIYMLNSGGLALIPPDMAHMTTYLAGSDHTRYVLYFNNDEFIIGSTTTLAFLFLFKASLNFGINLSTIIITLLSHSLILFIKSSGS